MQTGVPRQAAVNVFKQAPDFQASFALPTFLIALSASLVWAWLVKWRIGRHQPAIWKSLVLPAGGAALCWLLLMTLWMPLLDFVRSYQLVVTNISAKISPETCLQVVELDRDQAAALQYHGGFRLEPETPQSSCRWLIADPGLLAQSGRQPDPDRWTLDARVRRASGKGDEVYLFQRKD